MRRETRVKAKAFAARVVKELTEMKAQHGMTELEFADFLLGFRAQVGRELDSWRSNLIDGES